MSFVVFLLIPAAVIALTIKFFRYKHRRGTWAALLVGNALVLGSILSVGFVCAETYFRFIYDATEATTSTLTSRAWYARHWQTNSAGCRDIEWAPTVPGKKRFFFIGDSFLAGYGVKNVEDRFANIIRRRHAEWYLYVMGYPGADTQGEIGMLKGTFRSGEHYEEDTVVLIYNMNDVGDIVDRWFEGVSEIMKDPFRQSWLCEHSYFVNLFYNRWQQRRNEKVQGVYEELQSAYEDPTWSKQAEQLRQVKEIVQSHGARLMVVTFPDLHATGKDYLFRKGHERLNKFWREEKVSHLDLLPVFENLTPKEITVNRHDAHPNEKAHAIAADAIDLFLKQEAIGGTSRLR